MSNMFSSAETALTGNVSVPAYRSLDTSAMDSASLNALKQNMDWMQTNRPDMYSALSKSDSNQLATQNLNSNSIASQQKALDVANANLALGGRMSTDQMNSGLVASTGQNLASGAGNSNAGAIAAALNNAQNSNSLQQQRLNNVQSLTNNISNQASASSNLASNTLNLTGDSASQVANAFTQNTEGQNNYNSAVSALKQQSGNAALGNWMNIAGMTSMFA